MVDLDAVKRRRDAYMKRLGEGGAALLSSPPELVRNGDSTYAYRQSSDIYYLTGFTEPGATVLLRPGADEPFVMFVRPRDPEREVWDGRRAGVEGACATYSADAAYPNTELAEKLPELIANLDTLYYSLGDNSAFDQRLIRAVAGLRRRERHGFRPPRHIADPRFVLHELRLLKTPDEIATLRRAAEITCEAHRAAMAMAAPGVTEYELEAAIDYTFRRRGGTGPGYTTIVGAGDNATILHYIENVSPLADGDLVLIDAGCELDFYTADVTRTFPASGRFSEPQRRCYEVVLEAQKRAIDMARPGVTIDEIHETTVRVLTEGMIELGLLAGTAEQRIEDESYKRYYMHRTSHWLGLDVHDAGTYTVDGLPRPLGPGMVITIEPGLYVAAADDDAPAELRGIGIRIEDDVLITEGGNDVLTTAAPKEIAEVEAACQAGGVTI
jgi:Xaa-Pro aminopeptidase